MYEIIFLVVTSCLQKESEIPKIKQNVFRLIFKYRSFKRTMKLCFSVTLAQRRDFHYRKKCAHDLFRGRIRYGECATHCFRSAPSLQSRVGYKPSIDTPRSDPTQLHLPSSPWLQGLRDVVQIFRSRFPRVEV